MRETAPFLPHGKDTQLNHPAYILRIHCDRKPQTQPQETLNRKHLHKRLLHVSANKNAQSMKTGARIEYRLLGYGFWNHTELAESKFWCQLQQLEWLLETHSKSGCFSPSLITPVQSLKCTWWTERTDPCKLSSNLHLPAVAGFPPHSNSINVKQEHKVLKAKNWTVNV